MNSKIEDKEQIAAGLRAIERTKCAPPDVLLHCDNEGNEYDSICGIPVVYSALIRNSMTDWDVPWIPLWYKQNDYIIARAAFNRAFEGG